MLLTILINVVVIFLVRLNKSRRFAGAFCFIQRSRLLKIWKDYYLDASSVYYTLKKAHTKADGGVEYDICTYHARLEDALAEAVRRTIREGVASGELKEWEQVRAELQSLEREARGLLQSVCPADKAFAMALKNNKCA